MTPTCEDLAGHGFACVDTDNGVAVSFEVDV
jgi:hypothetical protein